MGNCRKKKCYENLQALIEVKKHQSVKCFAEHEVLKQFVIKRNLSVTQFLRVVRVAMGEDKEKEIELCKEIVRTEGILKYFQSKLASCEEVSKKSYKLTQSTLQYESTNGARARRSTLKMLILSCVYFI